MLTIERRDTTGDPFATLIFATPKTRFDYRAYPSDHYLITSTGFDWFFDDVPGNLEQLKPIIKRQTRPILLMGWDSGGYGALLFAGLLSQLYPNKTFKVLALAPITYFHVGECFHRKLSMQLRGILDEGKYDEQVEKYGDLAKILPLKSNNLQGITVGAYRENWVEDIRYCRHVDSPPYMCSKTVASADIPKGPHNLLQYFLTKRPDILGDYQLELLGGTSMMPFNKGEVKSIAIVGSAPTITDHKHGEEIDAHDIVIRVNWGMFAEEEEIYGKKADVWTMGLQGDLMRRAVEASRKAKAIWAVGPWSHFCDARRKRLYRLFRHCRFSHRDEYKRGQRRLESRDPTSGMFAIMAALERFPKVPIDLYGFGFDKDRQFNIHSKNSAKGTSHDFPFEKEYIKKQPRLTVRS